MNAPESGFFSGDYTASSAAKGLDNLNVLNYDFSSVYDYENGNSEAKYSSRLQFLSSLQNARIPEVNTAISASSCTFAWGGIEPGKPDPILDRLVGPSYPVVFVDSGAVQGSVSSPPENYGDTTLHVPRIPFKNVGNQLTTYNIWHIQGADKNAVKFVGPANTATNTGTIRTVKDPTYGAQVEVTSYNTDTSIYRYFYTSQDAVYQSGAKIFNPDTSIQDIKARGNNGNNSFHINLSASNVDTDKSAIRIRVSPNTPNNNYINDFIIELKIDKKPVIYILDPDTNTYITQTDVSAPVFDKNNCTSYDIFVHFVGPNLLIGFTADVSRWNTIIGFANREVFCPADTRVEMKITNVNIKFRYSALIFNNFNNNQSAGSRQNYMIGEFKYSAKKIPDPVKLLQVVKNSFENASYRINDNPRTNSYNALNPIDKNISYFADLRLPGPQFVSPIPYAFSKYQSADPDKKTIYFKMVYNTTIEGPALLQVEMPHPGVLGSAGAANVGNFSGSDYKFVNPNLSQLFYDVGDITSWVEDWSVQTRSTLANLSRIEKTASIKLKNIDSLEGQAFINAIENNLICVSIDAGYVQGQLYPFFQGFINKTSYRRTGNDSTFTLECTDIASYVLRNIYFDKNMMIGGMRHDLALDSIMACSGFWSFYSRNNAGIDGMDLRLNSQSVNNQDLIKLNPLDKILDKFDQLLERLNTPDSLPTFRWAERYGFILEGRNNNLDSDLKFTGLNDAGSAYVMNSNATNQKDFLANYQTDIHGLLVGDYTISTNMDTLAAGVRAFGSSITGFLADERYFPDSVSVDNMNIGVKLKLLQYLANAPFDSAQAPYVGFKKYLISSFQRNQIPDQTVLRNITNQYQKIARTPISNISFSCYVSKPLSVHGKFIIKTFLGDTINSTDQYIYQQVDYTYDKGNNHITASVQGINIPILIKDL